jgi:hypothetical protein
MSSKVSNIVYSYNRLAGRSAVSNTQAINIPQLELSTTERNDSSQLASSFKAAFLVGATESVVNKIKATLVARFGTKMSL